MIDRFLELQRDLFGLRFIAPLGKPLTGGDEEVANGPDRTLNTIAGTTRGNLEFLESRISGSESPGHGAPGGDRIEHVGYLSGHARGTKCIPPLQRDRLPIPPTLEMVTGAGRTHVRPARDARHPDLPKVVVRHAMNICTASFNNMRCSLGRGCSGPGCGQSAWPAAILVRE